MRYAQIRKQDISNGEGVGVSLFVQGCKFHCENCFNPETWNFDGGNEWTEEVENDFLKLLNRPYITRVSILGGEPLEHPYQIFLLATKIKNYRKDIKIWLYSGYTYEEILQCRETTKTLTAIDVLVDGRYIDELRDYNLKFRGSSNQRIIDVKKSFIKGEIIEYIH